MLQWTDSGSLAWPRRSSILAAAALAGCGAAAGEPGPCGPVLTAAECAVAATQLGSLSHYDAASQKLVTDPPPPDPTSRVGRGGDAELNAAKLGQYLFFDVCLSQDKQTACSTCHEPAAAYGDPRLHALRLYAGADPVWRRGQTSASAVRPNGTPAYTGRNSPTIYNVAYGNGLPQFDANRGAGVTWGPWDGRYDSMWSLVAEVYEFGATNRSDRGYIAARLNAPGPARDLYLKAFGAGSLPPTWPYPLHATPSTAVDAKYAACWNSNGAGDCPQMNDDARKTINTIFYNSGKALSAYMRQIQSAQSPYDRWLLDPAARNAMSESAQRGLRLFLGKAECVLCHSGPNFTDLRFHNLGVPTYDPELFSNGSNAVPGQVLTADCLPGAPPSATCPDWGHYAWQNKIAGQCVGDSCQRTAGGSCLSGYSDATDKPTQCLPLSSYDPCSTSAKPDECLRDVLCKTAPAGSTCAAAFDQCLLPGAADRIGCLQAVARGRGTDLPCPTYGTDRAVCEGRSEGRCALVESQTPAGAVTRRCVPLPLVADIGAFKTPSLRNAARTWPYMHNGALGDFGPQERGELTNADDVSTPHLLAVIEFYNQGGGTPAIGTRDPLLRPLHLTPSEKRDLVEFLQALTDESAGPSSEYGKRPTDQPGCP